MTLILSVQTVNNWKNCYVNFLRDLETDQDYFLNAWTKYLTVPENATVADKIKLIKDTYFASYLDLCAFAGKEAVSSNHLIDMGLNPVAAEIFSVDAFIRPIVGKAERIRLTLNKRIKDKDVSTVAGSFSARLVKHFTVDNLPVEGKIDVFAVSYTANELDLLFDCCGIVGAPVIRSKINIRNTDCFDRCNELLKQRFEFIEKTGTALTEKEQELQAVANSYLPCSVDSYMYYLYAFGLIQ